MKIGKAVNIEGKDMNMKIREYIKNNILILDGAMGTMIQKKGIKPGQLPEVMNITDEDIILSIHKAYIDAGAKVITTNTFGANEIKLDHSGYEPEEIITKAIDIAKRASKGKDTFIALDIGPIGQLLEPMGTLTFERAYEIFKRQVDIGTENGVDIILIETMTDLYEAKAAVLAAKENSNIPVFCTMTFEEDKRTFTGCTPLAMTTVLQGLGVDALGINCSLGPEAILPMIKEVIKYSKVPVMVQPNGGLPKVIDNIASFPLTPEEFAQYGIKFIEAGVNIVGGCCGTNDDHIKSLYNKLKDKKPVKVNIEKKSIVSTATNTIIIDKIKIIGERINPTGKKLFKEALIKNNIDYVLKEAILQVEAGANILDVNVGLPDIDEKKMMTKVVKEIQSILDVPLQIDSNKAHVIEGALRVYNGKAIVNSVNGDNKVLDEILPMVKKYGAAVIGLTLDEKGIPKTAEERLTIAEKILKRAEEHGIEKEDVYIDCLTLTAAAQQKDVMETLRAVTLVREKLKVNTVLGVSNVSFGLPNRTLLNKTFLGASLMAGLTLPIINPLDDDTMDIIRAYRVLSGEDLDSKKYLSYYGVEKNENHKQIIKTRKETLFKIIINGLKGEAKEVTLDLLKEKKPLNIVNEDIIPALDYVGESYEKGEKFLPQLIQSAETVKVAFELIKETLKKDDEVAISRGTIVLATVKGDIHDIGKNIVKILLENYGFDIIDLGKDVPIDRIVDAVKRNNIALVGLSALMTTTVKNMEETIGELRRECPCCKIMVGGAVLNREYAMNIGADYYGKDAKESVNIAKEIFKK